jgi:hypothetical protein
MLLGAFGSAAGIRAAQGELARCAGILAAAAVLLGVGNVFRVNLREVTRRGPDWPYKAVLLACLSGTCLAGMAHPLAWGVNDTGPGTVFDRLYRTAYAPLQSTTFALLGLCVASAAYRALRVRGPATLLLAASAVAVMLGQIAPGTLPWPGGAPAWPPAAAQVRDWILAVPAMAARRGLCIGAALGAVALGWRVIAGLERPHLGDG